MKHLEPFLAAADTLLTATGCDGRGQKSANRLYSMSEDARDEFQKAAEVMEDEVGRAVEGHMRRAC